MAITSGYTYDPNRYSKNPVRVNTGSNIPQAKSIDQLEREKNEQQKVAQPAPQPIQKPAPQQTTNFSPMSSEKVSSTASKTHPEETEKSNKRFALRLTSQQRNQLKKLKKSWGLSTESAVIKKLIDDAKDEPNKNDLAHQISELSAIRAELNHIGINVNQIAKQANQMGLTSSQLVSVKTYLDGVIRLIYGMQKGGANNVNGKH